MPSLSAALLACSLGLVHPSTLERVIAVESNGNAAVVHVNHDGSVDRGLMQINSRNLSYFGVSAEQVMDPCTNVRIGSQILAADYAAATRLYGEGQRALMAALSAYNSGSFTRGLTTYVPRFFGNTVLRSIGCASCITAKQVAASRPRPVSPYEADGLVYWDTAVKLSAN